MRLRFEIVCVLVEFLGNPAELVRNVRCMFRDPSQLDRRHPHKTDRVVDSPEHAITHRHQPRCGSIVLSDRRCVRSAAAPAADGGIIHRA